MIFLIVFCFCFCQAAEILRTDYEPSDIDILYAEGVTSSNGLACVDFSFPQSAHDEDSDTADQHDSSLRWVVMLTCSWLYG